MRNLDVRLAAVLLLAACSTAGHRPESDEKRVEIFTSDRPKKPFVEVSRLDFYVEKWSRDTPSMDDFRPELEQKARLSGADAVVDLEWSLKGTAEVGIYHVTGKGIAYSARPGSTGSTAAAEPPAASTSSPGGRDVELLEGPPARPFIKVSHLDLYVEKKVAGEPSLEEILPELKKQARLSGAEAIMEVEWTLRGTKEAGIYHVTATGIAYSAPASSPTPVGAGTK
jgi:uncharacterized protein YbjQ (UPF0145 family)